MYTDVYVCFYKQIMENVFWRISFFKISYFFFCAELRLFSVKHLRSIFGYLKSQGTSKGQDFNWELYPEPLIWEKIQSRAVLVHLAGSQETCCCDYWIQWLLHVHHCFWQAFRTCTVLWALHRGEETKWLDPVRTWVLFQKHQGWTLKKAENWFL